MKKIVFLIILVIPICLFSAIKRVPQDFNSIQLAINQTAHNDTVLVSSGTYNESIDFLGLPIKVMSLYGVTSDTTYINQTIINATGNYHAVSFTNNETTQSQLIGFTITGGNATGEISVENPCANAGGGVLIHNSGATILHCKFVSNASLSYGGAMAIYNGNIVNMEGCLFLGNYSNQAGALFVAIANNLNILNSTFKNNSAALVGGIVVMSSNNVTISNSYFYNNSTEREASSLVSVTSNINIDKCVFYNNSGINGTIALVGKKNNGYGAIITNSTFNNNSGGAVYGQNGSKIIMANNILWNNTPYQLAFVTSSNINTAVFTNNCIQDGQEGIANAENANIHWFTGNISDNPQLLSSEDYNFNLTENSPCIDSGIASFSYENSEIINLPNSDFYGIAPDIGAFEYSSSNANNPSITAKSDSCNYPNPFNPSTTIEYNLEKTGNVKLDIYNAKGQHIKTLVNKYQASGKLSVVWNGTDNSEKNVASGIYFYKLKINNEVSAKKMLLVK